MSDILVIVGIALMVIAAHRAEKKDERIAVKNWKPYQNRAQEEEK